MITFVDSKHGEYCRSFEKLSNEYKNSIYHFSASIDPYRG